MCFLCMCEDRARLKIKKYDRIYLYTAGVNGDSFELFVSRAAGHRRYFHKQVHLRASPCLTSIFYPYCSLLLLARSTETQITPH